MSNIVEEYDKLNLLSDDAPKEEKIRRGRQFEKLIQNFFQSEFLQPNLNLKPSGEEIDGSFILGEKVYLFETKWHKEPISASAIYSFKGKLDGKLIGTIGIFISISGFSKDAVDALTHGKTLNIILFDKQDFEYALRDGFKNVFLFKIRESVEYGNIYAKYENKLKLENKTSIGKVQFLCEGESDLYLLGIFNDKIQRKINKQYLYTIMSAGGFNLIPKVFQSNRNSYIKSNSIIVVDTDNDKSERMDFMKKNIDLPNEKFVFFDPSLKDELENITNMDARKTMEAIPIERLLENKNFKDLYDKIIKYVA